jgi:hypothetical protein
VELLRGACAAFFAFFLLLTMFYDAVDTELTSINCVKSSADKDDFNDVERKSFCKSTTAFRMAPK